MDINVLYEDSHVIVAVKPSNLISESTPDQKGFADSRRTQTAISAPYIALITASAESWSMPKLRPQHQNFPHSCSSIYCARNILPSFTVSQALRPIL